MREESTSAGTSHASHTSRRHARPLPISYNFLGGAHYAIQHRRGPLPGVNQWHLRPNSSHPTPVVLIHGTAGSGVTNWISLGPTLVNEGYAVFALTYGALPGASFPVSELGGLRGLTEHSIPQVKRFVDKVLQKTGASHVDLVAHSQGGLIAGAIAKNELPGKIRKVVSLASPWKGIGGDRIAWMLKVSGVRPLIAHASEMADDLVEGSEFLRDLYGSEGTPYAQGVDYTNIETRYDQIVVPHTSALLEPPTTGSYRVTNIVLQHGCMIDFVDHAALPSDPRAIDFVLNALDPAHPQKPRCLPTVPLFGEVLKHPTGTAHS